MGGHSHSAAPTATEKDVSNAAIRPMTQVPAAMPGQLDALSQQLAMGFGVQPSDLLALMNQYYQPMQLPDYSPGAAPVMEEASSAASPATVQHKPVSSAGWHYINGPKGPQRVGV